MTLPIEPPSGNPEQPVAQADDAVGRIPGRDDEAVSGEEVRLPDAPDLVQVSDKSRESLGYHRGFRRQNINSRPFCEAPF